MDGMGMTMESDATRRSPRPGRSRQVRNAVAGLVLAAGLLGAASISARQPSDDLAPDADTSLGQTRLAMGKWIETQQIIARERNEWQQAREVLTGRLDLVRQEIATLNEKIAQAQSNVGQAEQQRHELQAQNAELKATAARLGQAASGLESGVRELYELTPEPVRARLQPLVQRIPEDPSSTRVSVAERFQNVLGILNELNKSNHDISVNYEVRTLSSGKPAEVKVVYVGLAQAYYVSSGGEGGIGRPARGGWDWEPSNAVAADVLQALEILQGKHTPAFVPLPVKIQ